MARFWARWEAGRPIPNNNKLVATGSHKGGRAACYTPCVIAIFTQCVSLCYCVRAWFRVTLCWFVCRHVLVGVSWWHTMGTCYEGFELAENVWIPKTFKTSARDFIWLGWEESLTIWFTYSQSRLALHVAKCEQICTPWKLVASSSRPTWSSWSPAHYCQQPHHLAWRAEEVGVGWTSCWMTGRSLRYYKSS